jgi:hypothetical protein
VPEKKTFIEGCSNKDSATAILEILKAVGVKDPATYMPTYFANLTSASYWETQKVFVVVVYIHYSMEVPANTRAKDISTYFKDKFSVRFLFLSTHTNAYTEFVKSQHRCCTTKTDRTFRYPLHSKT